jgi:hypothetical protein
MVYNLTTLSSLSYVIATPVLCLGYVLALAAWVVQPADGLINEPFNWRQAA